MADAEAERLAHADYWDERYNEAGPDNRLHEWFRSFGDLEPFFDKHLFQAREPGTNPRILHLGSGDSTIPDHLAERGYRNQLCADFSTVVVELMSKRHANIEGIEWKQMDVRRMENLSSESIDVAFDKGTLDAMIHGSPWSPPDDVLENTGQYIRETFRVLKSDGIFLYVTYRQPHFVKPLLSPEGTTWDINVEVLGGSGSTFQYHAFTLKKAAKT